MARDRFWSADGSEKTIRNHRALFVVSGTDPAHPASFFGIFGCFRFSEIMSENRQRENHPPFARCILPFGNLDQSIERESGMRKNISFRMPFRFLRTIF